MASMGEIVNILTTTIYNEINNPAKWTTAYFLQKRCLKA